MVENGSDDTPITSAPLDEYGDAAREYFRNRTAAVSAKFFVSYLKSAMDLLDCGCGEGTVTVDLAELVAPGTVAGIDISADSIERARQLASDRKLTNIRFEVGSVYELPFPDASFDAVFSHALFEHLTDKAAALQEIKRVLKPQGILGLRSPDFRTRIIEPFELLVNEFWELCVRIRDELGGDSQMGRHVYGLLLDAGFKNVISSASCESYGTPQSLQWHANVMSEFALNSHYAHEWIKRGWAGRQRLEEISAAYQVWAKQPNAFAVWWVWGEAVGWKE
jgi:ubiquinone/menaquinone biosynthesis C-methylase UbiE